MNKNQEQIVKTDEFIKLEKELGESHNCSINYIECLLIKIANNFLKLNQTKKKLDSKFKYVSIT